MKIVGKIVKGLGFLIGIILVYLVVIIFFPVLQVAKQPIPKRGGSKKAPPNRHDVQFRVENTTIRGWLYLPEGVETAVPCIVMSTGFAGTMDVLLEQYAQHFTAAGMAVLTFDYRTFGLSDGEPRQLFSAGAQLDDLRAAVAYARSRPEIDADRIVCWGTSAAGGYGIVIASEDEQIAAVITQCASLDHEADSKLFMERLGVGYFLRLFMHAQRDKGRSRFGLSPHIIPAVGEPGTLAMHNAPGAFAGYAKLMAGSETFVNEVCARMLLMPDGPDVIEAAEKVQCPVLILVCEHDNIVAPDSHKRVEAALGDKARVYSYPIGHFDIYEGEYFESAVGEKLAFLREHLALA